MEIKNTPFAKKETDKQKAIAIAFAFSPSDESKQKKLTEYQEKVLRRTLLGRLVHIRLQLRDNPRKACANFERLARKTNNTMVLFEEAVTKIYCANLARANNRQKLRVSGITNRLMNTLKEKEKEKEAEEILRYIGTKETQAAGYLLYKFFKEEEPISREIFFFGIFSAAHGFFSERTAMLPDLDKQELDRTLRPPQKDLTLLSGIEILEIIRILVVYHLENGLSLSENEQDILISTSDYLDVVCNVNKLRKAEKWEYLCGSMRFLVAFIHPDLSEEFKLSLNGENSPFNIEDL